jgi:MoxR-like ATPase
MSEASTAPKLGDQDIQDLKALENSISQVRKELGKVIIGQDEVINQLLVAIFSRGHCLLEGVPGLAKTLMVSTLARCMQMQFRRIQFTPDLMPSDITGTEVLQEDKTTGARVLKFMEGPIFGNVILADEINRTPPKTQAALLEAMQEKQVTIGGQRYKLPDPFFVLATQNPIEQEGTYTLPEAQQDRFMFKVLVEYPNYDEEYVIAETTTADHKPTINEVLTGEQIIKFQELVRKVPVPEHTIHYVLRLVRATRIHEPEAPDFAKEYLSWGAGTRAVQNLILAGKATAIMAGRTFVSTDDIKALAKPVMRHRLVTTFNAESQGITTDQVVDMLLENTPDRGSNDEVAPQLARAFE